MIFLVFGTGALNALRLFYFKTIFENEHIAYTHFYTLTMQTKKSKAFYISVLNRSSIILMNI